MPPASVLRCSRRHLIAVLGVGALLATVSLTALAAVTGTLTLGAPTVDPGASTTVDATFAEDAAGGVLGLTIVRISVTSGAGATGSATLNTADVTCVPNSGVTVECLWSAGSTSKTVALTATASADASGTFDIATEVEAAYKGPSLSQVLRAYIAASHMRSGEV